jgi:hypothetical protein
MTNGSLPLARFRALLAAYGARPEHWPARERQAALALLESSEAARSVARDEHALDEWLALTEPPRLGDELVRRLNAIPEGRVVPLGHRLRARRLVAPLVGWAAAAAVGLWLGANSVRVAGDEGDTTQESAEVDDSTLVAIARGSFAEISEEP